MKTNDNVLRFIKKKNRKYQKRVEESWFESGDKRDEGAIKV